ncbi:MAG: glycosyltransferase family 2 protein [Lachnospiraceae bacterium]|nr:glycosyltransferase family 2 protein [Lachnospiraceae bacterium]
MDNELISIIVPVFGVEKYIRDCLDSIISQTYKNIEIIVVDDGSKDKSGDIADQYAEIDQRILIIHKDNGGLSDARNVGIDHCHGSYITFIDSDDFVSSTYIEHLYNLIKLYDTKISSCMYQIFSDNLKIETEKKITTRKVNSDEAIELMLFRNGITHIACAKLYHKSIFENSPKTDFSDYMGNKSSLNYLPVINGRFRFPVGILNEDLATIYYLVEEVESISISNAQLYYYRSNPKSITKAKVKATDFSVFELYDLLSKHLERYFPMSKAGIIELKGTIYVKLYKRLVMNNQREFSEQMDFIQEYLKMEVRNLKDYTVRFPTKIRMVVGSKSRIFFKILSIIENCLGAKS